MRINTIYAVFLATAVMACTASAQSARGENLEKYYTMERIRSKSGWLVSDNAAGLIFNRASLSTADVSYDFEEGGLRNVGDAARTHKTGIQSESFQRWDRLSFYGKLGYDYIAGSDRNWAGNTHLYTSPMNVGDSVPGNTRNETYLLKAGVAYQMGNWVIGLQGEYENQSLAKRRDARNKTTYMHLSVRPGVMFTSKTVDAGLNFTYERTTETVNYLSFGTNEQAIPLYLFEGLWFYMAELVPSGSNSNPIHYKESEYGGAAQFELKFSPRVSLFNQFSAIYGKMERYHLEEDEHLGDNDRLTYRYLGVLNVTGRSVDQQLSVDASWGDLLKYNNIQELAVDPVTNLKYYKQYGRFLKFSQKQRSVDADYKLYVKRNEWSSSWIVDVAYEYCKTESEYTISPARYNQDLHYSKLMLGVTKNFRFSGRSWLDATVRGGYTFGGGTELEKSCPEGVQIDNENYRADLLAQEYAFLTNDRLNGEAGLRYTHCFPAKKMSLYVDLKGRAAWGRSGLMDGSRRGGLFAAVGLNF